MVAHFIHGIDSPRPVQRKRLTALLNYFSDRFLFYQLWPTARSAQGHGCGLTARKLFHESARKKRSRGKLSVRDLCTALGPTPAMTLMRESAKEQAAPKLSRIVRTHVTTDSRVRYLPESCRRNGLPSA